MPHEYLLVNFRSTALLTNQPRFEIFFYGIAEPPKRKGAPEFQSNKNSGHSEENLL